MFQSVRTQVCTSMPFRSAKEELLGPDRICKISDSAQEKKEAESEKQGDALESVFSAHSLPKEFYQDFLVAHSALAWIDLACGQAESAKACLLERKAFVGVTLSEAHSKRIEILLTNYLTDEFQREGSTFYRPESVGVLGKSENEQKLLTVDPKPKKGSKRGKKKTDGEGSWRV